MVFARGGTASSILRSVGSWLDWRRRPWKKNPGLCGVNVRVGGDYSRAGPFEAAAVTRLIGNHRLDADLRAQAVGDVALAVRNLAQVQHALDANRLVSGARDDDLRLQDDHGQRLVRHLTDGFVAVPDHVEPGPCGHRQE